MDWFGLGLGSACHPTCSSQGRSISNLLSTVWLVETKFVGSSVGWFGFLRVIRFEGKTREMKQRKRSIQMVHKPKDYNKREMRAQTERERNQTSQQDSKQQDQ